MENNKEEIKAYLRDLVSKNNKSIEKTLRFLSSPELPVQEKIFLEKVGIIHGGYVSLIIFFYYLN